MLASNMVFLILILPLFSSIINGLFANKVKCSAGFIACSVMFITSLIAIALFCKIYNNSDRIEVKIKNWFSIEDIDIYWSMVLDRFTAMIILVVSLISTVVHFYSVGYMHDDPNITKYFSYLTLFTFFMFVLVGANNFIQLFLGWEGVGLCSYLLIGFWHHKESANQASIKAFIVNRVGDFFFILGIILIYYYTKQLDFPRVFNQASFLTYIKLNIFNIHLTAADVICLLLFLGCMGKSAQIGLHTWLADAMEGPTPVSALIHAATMVTAGVFLVAKCSFLFEYSPITLQFITIIGGITCIFAASIAIAQTDIKKIIAYSTCSQLGYMFLACGVSAYRTAVFHLVTHAFFKALMFLLAGNIIYATHEQNIFKLGGLRKKLPLTYINFLIASLALIGIYPLAGFYSKDVILEAAYAASPLGRTMFYLGIMGVLLTAIYCFKIIILTFYVQTNLPVNEYNNIVEPPRIMNASLTLLAMGTFLSGMLGYYILRIGKISGYLLDTVFKLHGMPTDKISLIIKILPMFIGLIGIFIAGLFYATSYLNPIKPALNTINPLLNNGYYFNDIYRAIFEKGSYALGTIFNFSDRKIIDKVGPGSSVNIVNKISDASKLIQTGYINNYLTLTLLGIVSIMTYFIINNNHSI